MLLLKFKLLLLFYCIFDQINAASLRDVLKNKKKSYQPQTIFLQYLIIVMFSL